MIVAAIQSVTNLEVQVGPLNTQIQTLAPTPKSIAYNQGKHRLFRILFLVTILMSGAVQFFSIYILAALNLSLWFLLYATIKFRFDTRTKYLGAFFLIYLLYSVIISGDFSDFKYIAFRFHDFLTAILLINYVLIKRIDFEKQFNFIFMGIMIYGFVNFILSNFFFGLFTQIPNEVSYRFLLFFGREETYYSIHRSQGFFWEPGVFQMYLNIFLFYCLFYKKNIRYSAALFLSIGLTLSTTGILISAVQFFAYFMQRSKSFGNTILKVVILLPILVTYVGFSSDIFNDKVSGDRAGSFWARSFDTKNGLSVAISHPFGIGFSSEKYQKFAKDNTYGIQTVLVTDRGQTNSIVMLFYTTGFLWAIVLLYFTFKQKIFPRKRVLFFFILMLSLSTEALFFSPFILLFPMSGMLATRKYLIE